MVARTEPRPEQKRSATFRPKRRRFTIDEYEKMVEAGIIRGERLELIDGEILCMATIGLKHASTVLRLNYIFNTRLAGQMLVSVQSPARMPPRSEPEPDLLLLFPRDDFYAAAHPSPQDVMLLIEVADTTLIYDRDRKMPRYAMGGVREAWLVDLNGQQVLVYRAPEGGRYRETLTFRRGETISPLMFPDFSIAVDEILGSIGHAG